ncbi:uncharacterized protein A4U43_C06F16730 [Asparagus officinalis]|uniref:Plant disease resistance WDH domain-containing protein n=1 Tax=Asparagus officinalis TaxID=4686 RepID=A0A5P1EPU9_ASPOF|nr:uncharacterized protein A4U43_C06F16730 [Asparagus officinalis]
MSFHSAAQSFTPSDNQSQLGNTHVPISPFADPPILPSTIPPLEHSVEHLKGTIRSHQTSTVDYTSDDTAFMSSRMRSCDVYIGVSSCRKRPTMVRFVRWLQAELEMQGFSCFVIDRTRCRSVYDHGVARSAMDATSFGVVVVNEKSFSCPYSMEEIRFFLEKKKLIPIFFGLAQVECIPRDIIEKRGDVWERYGGRLWEVCGDLEVEWREAVNGISRLNLKLEANASNLRDCISEAVVIFGSGLGRRRVVERVKSWRNMAAEEFPFPRNSSFVGRSKELLELKLLLFGDVEGEGEESRNQRRQRMAEVAMRERVVKESEERRKKGKEPLVQKEYVEESKAQGEPREVNLEYGKGIACVSGDSGIGKTELLLEYAYSFSQRYKMILWVGGESRYLRHNYMKLLPLLGIDTDTVNKLSSDKKGPQSLEDMEDEAIRRVRKEFSRDIPYLLVIDNLEREKDWWDGRTLKELFPRFGGATHVLISTRLPKVMDIEPMRLLYLSSAEAMILMNRSTVDLGIEDVDALRILEEKVGRLPFGLELVGAVLSEFAMKPSKLVDAINSMSYKEVTWNKGEDLILKRNPFLGQLLEFCLSLCNQEPSKLALRIVQASGLFAPSPIPVPILTLAAKEPSREHHNSRFWLKSQCMPMCMCIKTPCGQISEAEVLAMLLRLRIAKSTTKIDHISFHDILKLHAYKKGNSGIAHSVVRAIKFQAFIPQHSEHIWAACFLLFKFDTDHEIINISIDDLLSFVEQFVLPLAMHSFITYFCCNAVLELLRLATEKFEELENSFLDEANNNHSNSSCLRSSGSISTLQSNPLLYRKFAHLRATLLETRAKIMLRGGVYDIGERLCRTAVSIKEVIYGWEHPETVSCRETLDKFVTLQPTF